MFAVVTVSFSVMTFTGQIVFVLLSVLLNSAVFNAEWFRHEMLSPHYHVYWQWAQSATESDLITFKIEAKTLGWVGLGFSHTGTMEGADIVVGGVAANGTAYIQDRHGIIDGYPPLDKISNYRLLSATQNDTHTSVTFQRKINTCDEKQDVEINNGSMTVLWAYGETNPYLYVTFVKIDQHSFTARGGKTLFLLNRDSLMESQLPNNYSVVDITAANISVPNNTDTIYWCKVIKLPTSAKGVLIKYEPRIEPGTEHFVQRITILHCRYNMSTYANAEGICYDPNNGYGYNFEAAYYCYDRILVDWALGGDPVMMPDHMGIPMLRADQSPFVMIQIHIDNLAKKSAKINYCGMRLSIYQPAMYTDVGTITIGPTNDPYGIVIPPKQQKSTISAFCSANCTQGLPTTGITIIYAQLYTHLLGVAARLRQIRNGVELPPIISDDNYAYYYHQQKRILTNPITVLPNDVLLLECDYQSSNRSSPTLGGFSTQEEICYVVLDYYPKVKSLYVCQSTPSGETWANMFNTTFEGYEDNYGNLGVFLKDPKTGKTVDLSELVYTYKWPTDTKRYQSALSTGKYDVFCGGVSNTTSRTSEIETMIYSYIENVTIPQPSKPFLKQSACDAPDVSSSPVPTTNVPTVASTVHTNSTVNSTTNVSTTNVTAAVTNSTTTPTATSHVSGTTLPVTTPSTNKPSASTPRVTTVPRSTVTTTTTVNPIADISTVADTITQMLLDFLKKIQGLI